MKDLGNKGEDLAVTFLEKKGYRILARNYKTYIGEIDIVAKDADTIVIVEVKTRSSDTYGYPFEAVTNKKRQKMKNLALLYLKKLGKESRVRFDVLSITCSDKWGKTIEHIEDAFEV